MTIHNQPLQWYIDKLKKQEYFSQGMYGDGEWMAILGGRVGSTNAEGTIYTQELCVELSQSLEFEADDFLFSAPEIVKSRAATGIGEARIDDYLKSKGLKIEFYEKDVWDTAARLCQLQPLIRQLRRMNTIVISNHNLRLLKFLKYDTFIEIDYPNCHHQIDEVVEKCKEYGKPGVYLISAGLPASLLVQKLHRLIPKSWFLDVGSIWDAFVGIGRQRGWREELYSNHKNYTNWLEKSLENI